MKKMPFLLTTFLLIFAGIFHLFMFVSIYEILLASLADYDATPIVMLFWWPAALLTCAMSLHYREPERRLAKALFLGITLMMFYIFFKYFYTYLPPNVDF